MTDWVAVGVVTVVVIAGLFIFYRALQEPFDHFFKFLGWMFGKAKDGIGNVAGKASSAGANTVQKVITYD